MESPLKLTFYVSLICTFYSIFSRQKKNSTNAFLRFSIHIILNMYRKPKKSICIPRKLFYNFRVSLRITKAHFPFRSVLSAPATQSWTFLNYCSKITNQLFLCKINCGSLKNIGFTAANALFFHIYINLMK